MKDIIVIYHANCMDGFGAAYAAWCNFGDGADYVPAQYGQEPPCVAGKEVYILDFSYPRDVLIHMSEVAKHIKVLDHHKTAQDALQGLDFATFDMERSGCIMAWEFFFGEIPSPYGLQLIQDRDLWQFKYSDTKAYDAALRGLVPRTFEDWDQAVHKENVKSLVTKGQALLIVFNADVESLSKRAHLASLGDVRLIVCNAPPKYASELGNILSKNTGLPAAIYSFNGATMRFEYSLRSVDNFDVSELAREYGGGGHKNAAGFSLDYCAFDL